MEPVTLIRGNRGVNRRRTRALRSRTVIQLAVFLLIAAISVNHALAERGRAVSFVANASLHAICPLGGVVSVYDFATSGTFAQKTHEASFALMMIGFVVAILFGGVFCGWICPFGTFQEWIGKLGRRIFGRRYNGFVPPRLDAWLRYLRYVVLGWVVFMTAWSGRLVFEGFDPYYALFNFWTGEVAVTGYIVLAAVVVLGLFVERPFCKYACPYGAVIGVFNLFRVFGIRRKASTCIHCAACDRRCPMNITVSTTRTVRNHQCITCLECTSESSCPVPETVVLSTATGRTSPRREHAEGAAV